MFKETTHLTVMLFAAAVVLVASTETRATHQRHQRPNKQPRLDERPAGVAAAGVVAGLPDHRGPEFGVR
jgi:hypothetical protein